MPVLSADDDVAQAILKKWLADADTSTADPPRGLPDVVIGGLQRGRLSSFQPATTPDPDKPENKRKIPYATFAVAKLEAGMHDTGDVYIDKRLVTIEVRGTHAHVQDVMTLIRRSEVTGQAVFNRKQLATQAPFLACIQEDDPDITEDPARAEGEDVWIGTVKLQVWTDRDE